MPDGHQLTLFFKPRPDTDETAAFVEFLRGRDWIRASQITALTGWTDRQCRAFAAASRGHVISGQKGYKLTLECNPKEFARFEGFFTSQIREMANRIRNARRVYHRKGK
jgi:hypothetical protein